MGGYVLVVRPQPGLSATLDAAKARGLNAIGYPLFEIHPRQWEGPDPATIDALLIGSANAIRHGGDGLTRYLDKPVYAVGDATARAARDAGFAIAHVGRGGLQYVLDNALGSEQQAKRLLRIAGADHVALTMPDKVTVEARIAYEAVPLELPEPLRALHDLGLTVLLHSAAAAERFASEARRLALHRNRISIIAIGPRVAAAAGRGWRAIHVCAQPNDSAVLEMASEVCI